MAAGGGGAPVFATNQPILEIIANRFNEARDLNKAGAWKQLQRDLMAASPFIVPQIIPYKDLIAIVSDIEKEIKGTTAQAGRSNEELLAAFLSGDQREEGIPISEEQVVTMLERDDLDNDGIIGEADTTRTGPSKVADALNDSD